VSSDIDVFMHSFSNLLSHSIACNIALLSLTRASKAKTKIQTLQNQLAAESDLQTSAISSPDSLISSAEAIRLLKRFDVNLNVDTTNNNQPFIEQREIEVLEGMEIEFKATQYEFKEATRALQAAQRQVNAAIQAEQLAQEKLLHAQQKLANAQQQQFQAVQEEENAAVKEEEQAWQLQQQAERVKYVLQKVEKRSKQQLAVQIQREIQSLQDAADEWDIASLQIKQRANQMKQANEG
jgi:hypothetical protein